MVSEEMDRGGKPAEVMSRGERSAARLLWIESHNHYEDYESDNRFRINRLLPSTELMVAAAIVVFFFGSYAAFIAYLALTR